MISNVRQSNSRAGEYVLAQDVLVFRSLRLSKGGSLLTKNGTNSGPHYLPFLFLALNRVYSRVRRPVALPLSARLCPSLVIGI